MAEYTEEQVEEMVREAVEKTEKSFGGTFKRLKSENEEIGNKYAALVAKLDTTKKERDFRIEELESLLTERKTQISGLAVRGEIQRQLSEKGPLPERFVDVKAIEYSEDPEILKENVAAVIYNGRREFEQMMNEMGIIPPQAGQSMVNPTNPPSRDTRTAHDLKKADAREVLHDMTRRGLLR